MMWKVQLFKLNFDDREVRAVSDTVAGGWLTMGERTTAFEEQFSALMGPGVQSIAVANCTAALHMAVLAVGAKAGDEVIVPALTFVAAANAVRMVGATPVFADSGSLDNWNVTADSIRTRMSPRTKAVIVVHYAGFPCDMPAIVELCRSRGVRLIEDVAHAPGATVAGRSCGAWGDVGCFSFFSNKNLSIGEGGMVTATDPALHQELRFLRSHGMTTLTLDRHKGRAVTYDVAIPGLNYRMDEMRAAIGLVQLEKLASANRRRGELTERYRRNLSHSPVKMPFADLSPDSRPVYHILPVLLPKGADRLRIIESLKAAGIQSSIHYPPFWGFTAYNDSCSPQDFPVVAQICERELTLPLFPTMTDDEVDLVTSALLDCVH